MTNNNDTNINPTITLKNLHGTFTVAADRLELVLLKTKDMDLHDLRVFAAGLNGFGENSTAYHSEQRLEVCIMLLEGGNYPIPA